jgi:guanylate kinase
MSQSTTLEGLVFVLVGPSGAGKNSIMQEVITQSSQLRQMPTATTRAKRDSEREGREHYFHTKESFGKLIEADALLEWQWVHDNQYGIIRATIENAIAQQDDLIADIEVLGARIIKKAYPENAVLVFVCPPDRDTLEARIRARGADDEAAIKRRLQRVPFEMKFAAMCDYLIINEHLDEAAAHLKAIIDSERARRNVSNLVVSALFCHEGLVLVGVDGTDNQLPSTGIQPGESPEDALHRLAGEFGIQALEIQCQPGTPNDDTAPAHFEIAFDAANAGMALIFAGNVSRQSPAPAGWQWKAIEAVPTAAQYCCPQPHEIQ